MTSIREALRGAVIAASLCGPSAILALGGAAATLALSGPAIAQETVKIAFIDPLSGGGAPTGEAGLRHFQYMAEVLNARQKQFRFEVLAYDNKVNPQETLIAAQKGIDAGARVLVQGNGSSAAAALTDFVAKHNERNPNRQVIYINYSAVDPSLTNEKCNYWHFRFDANSDIKMEALTNFMRTRPEIKKVYLINQDYSFGQSVRAQARAMLKAKRPDIEIVGDEVTPLQKVNDFAPYITKIKASGADSVITGNWAQDFNLLLKAAAEAGLQATFYTYYAGGTGGPSVVRQTGLAHRVFEVSQGGANTGDAATQDFEAAFRARTAIGSTYPRVFNAMNALLTAMQEAGSSEARKVAPKLERARLKPHTGSDGYVRPDDHQYFQTMFVSSFGPMEPGMRFDEEGTGWGWKMVGRVETQDTLVPTTCRMDRPS
ncbi:branched-chain amino acid ABC transporter substrate-binding protein [Methylobacterium aquaticum]|uniref:branched-chain amino acid ABC transporter substrate-binding protein n=1 Tax=Methylobacterium aquaticum TaxID=270351 RepID=UPI0009E36B6C|nr:branched-chain amino acid ABC transporter substrate-binding protein [Methylobacterium aquaticum]